MIENETQYDSEQLASMQEDLRDNSIDSRIGIVPGADLGENTTGGMLGEEIAESFFRSDVTVQIATINKILKIKYVLTTVDEINKELYPSGLVREMDIENGGTLTFTKAGEYTITAATYDLEGRKLNYVFEDR